MLHDARVEATIPTADLERARGFYEGTLGLLPEPRVRHGREVSYRCADGTRLLVYERARAGTAEHTLVHFAVADLEATVAALRARGVVFEEYDLPDIKTVDGIAAFEDFKAAWFKDPDGNILGINS